MTWRGRLTVLLICTAQLVVSLDGSIVQVALPYIGSELKVSTTGLPWIGTTYALAFGGFLLIGGRLGDLYGRRRLFSLGLVVFALASLPGCFAGDVGMLLASRSLMGLGAAMIAPSALALLSTAFPSGAARTKAVGAYAMASAVGVAFGMVLGGWLTGFHNLLGLGIEGWRLTFLVNVPIGLLSSVFVRRFLDESHGKRGSFDVAGAVTGTAGLLAVTYAVTRIQGGARRWDDPVTMLIACAGLGLLAGFALIESRAAHPLLPLSVLSSRVRLASFAAFLLASAAMFAQFFYMNLFLQDIMGLRPMLTGMAFLPFSVGMIAGSRTASYLATRMQPRFVAAVGMLLAAAAYLRYAAIHVPDTPGDVLSSLSGGGTVGAHFDYWTGILPYFLLNSFGVGIIFVALTLTSLHKLHDEDSGVGSGVLNTVQQLGGAFGLTIISTIAAHVVASRTASVLPGLLAGLGARAHDVVPGTQSTYLQWATQQAALTAGAREAYLAAVTVMLTATALVLLFVSVRTGELTRSARTDQEAVTAASLNETAVLAAG